MREKLPTSTKEWLVFLAGTPVGSIILCFTDRGLAALEFAGEGALLAPKRDPLPPHLKPAVEAAKRELIAYFNGSRTGFAALTLDPQGTPFQLQVWQELRRIAWGQTISYKELARRVGNPKASRAVGQANAVNPIPLIIPCHRVIAADGSLGGYSSGLDRKRWLLRHEGVRSQESGVRF